jgi:mannose-6-phosphate isomerase-like protein (cupin superfamily)
MHVFQAYYRFARIVRIPHDNPLEIICEIDPTSKHPEISVALVAIDRSEAHWHPEGINGMAEQYFVVKGHLILHLGNRTLELKEGSTCIIPPNVVHWAEGDTTWVWVISTPGWTLGNHKLVAEHGCPTP